MVQVGDTLPSAQLQEGAPDKTIDPSKEITDGIIIGIPAAFSPTCSQGHIPKYVSNQKSPSSNVFVVGVNDVFVMEDWKNQLDSTSKSNIRFLADAQGDFARKLGLIFDATAFLGNERSQRYAIVVKGGKVEKVEVEPDPTKVTVTSADNILA